MDILFNRQTWLPNLAALPASDVIELANQCSQSWQRDYKALPEQGLGLLNLQESTQHEHFYLGEFPVAQAWVKLTLADGQVAEGAAHVLQDNAAFAEALAVCDAILSHQLSGWESIAAAAKQGQQIREQLAANRKQMLAKTRVDFSLLEMSDGENT